MLLDVAAAAAPAPDQLVALIQSVAQFGFGPVAVVLYGWFMLRREKGDGAEYAQLLARVDALATEVRALTAEREERARRERDAELVARVRAATLDDVRSGRTSAEFNRPDPTNPGR